jgi:hypothetical protein
MKKPAKLRLRKETLRTLSDVQLTRAVTGAYLDTALVGEPTALKECLAAAGSPTDLKHCVT